MEEQKVLVVDDEKGICRNVEKILAKGNYRVTQALSAKQALEKMAKETFSLLISDIVMPETNGLELLKLVKEQWPLTKVVMMTAYASTDTAVKAIRLGALDYVPKPFTPDELRSTVAKALSGELAEAEVTEKEKKAIDVIDVDIPFDKKEVARAAGEDYVDSLGPSDMPVVEMPLPETLPYYCAVGEKVCDIYKKLGNTCKAGLKTSECPQLNKVKSGKEKGGKAKGADARRLIGIDMPFDYEEVVSVTGPEYVRQLQHEGVGFVPYEELKRNRARGGGKKRDIIDLDVPFDRDEVARATGEAYADTLGPSDMPAVEVPAPEALQYYCAVGDKVCDVFKKLGNTCKAGMKTSECPQLKKVKKGAAKKKAAFDPGRLIGVEMPFAYEEVVAVTGHEFMENLDRGGVPPYETLKARVAGALEKEATRRAVVRKFPQRALTDEILVIDDEVAVNNNIRKILSKKGYEVEQAMTKEEALTRIGEKAYRVVLLDLKIPGVQGLELLRTIRDRSPETLVIIITGYASIETAKESARLGAVDYLPKPFTPDEVRKATEKAIRMAA